MQRVDVASVDLCRELWELSGWGTEATAFHWYKQHGEADYTLVSSDEAEFYQSDSYFPAYTLGFMLRKLQLPYVTVLVGTLGRRSKLYSASYIPDQLGEYDPATMYRKADTPENALCQLAIQLFRQNILKRDDGGSDK
jgi:hypothetical protein